MPIPRPFSFSINSSRMRLKRSRDRGQPCLTPALILIRLVVFPRTVIDVLLLEYISRMSELTCSGTPLHLNPFAMDLCDTVSEAIAKSVNTMLYSFFLRRWCLISCGRILTFSKQWSTGTNPSCLMSNLMLLRSRLFQIFAYSLINRFPIVIGRQLEGLFNSSTDFGIRVVLHSLALSGILCPHYLLSIAAIL